MISIESNVKICDFIFTPYNIKIFLLNTIVLIVPSFARVIISLYSYTSIFSVCCPFTCVQDSCKMTSFEYSYQNSRLSKCQAQHNSACYVIVLIDSFDSLTLVALLH